MEHKRQVVSKFINRRKKKFYKNKSDDVPLFSYNLSVWHEQLYAPRVVQHSEDSESISHKPETHDRCITIMVHNTG